MCYLKFLTLKFIIFMRLLRHCVLATWRYVFKKTVAGCSALHLEDEVVVAAVCVWIEMDNVATERKKAEVGKLQRRNKVVASGNAPSNWITFKQSVQLLAMLVDRYHDSQRPYLACY